ncbi:MAG: RusA family crossover junction endodeoxyribonuclease [Coleofasciculaceae cyanobacterium SM2_3_26]|nr:RusA family crossover junction endodeoxyribonuclease [Coleofasciculaceae cyanobacterium SM2_3_26]
MLFEFIIPGKPVSHQAKDRQRVRVWTEKVRQTAVAAWKEANPLSDPLRVIITHYYDAPDGNEDSVPDSDNIVKPVREALNGVLYKDDSQITDFISRRRNLNGSFRIRGMSPVLAEGFCKGESFLHVKIEYAPDPADLG